MAGLSESFLSLGITDPLLFYVVGLTAVLITALSKAGFGGAVSIGIPILLLVTTPRVALGITLPILLFVDVWVVSNSFRKVSLKHLIIMLIFGLLGHGIGWYYFDYISNDMLTGFIACLSLLAVFLFFRKRWSKTGLSGKDQTLTTRSLLLRGSFWCTLSGISSFISISGGIPLQMFLLAAKIERQVYIASASAFFFMLNLSKIPMYADLDILSSDIFLVSLSLVPGIPFGVLLARWTNNFLSNEQFFFVMHVILGIVGCQLLYQAIV